ncbi:hypothetical protein [Deinococcus aestuarii]|uniref:hypothetical protein n=1 Tax=Deinococcus aestuarii TaxID=2774531 RepID=UPI001C0AEAC1|nr:hypothetical protein [Deinococcus aestuarii]
MTHVPAPTQSFCQTIGGQPQIWATTPLVWLMSLWYQHNAYSTAGNPWFRFVDVATLIPHATAQQARVPTATAWSRADLAVPVILVQLLPAGAKTPKTVLVDGINRVRKLDSLGIPQVEVMIVPLEVAGQFEVPAAYATAAQALLVQRQTHRALQAIFDDATAKLLPQVVALRDAARQQGTVLPDLPLPQTLRYLYALP